MVKEGVAQREVVFMTDEEVMKYLIEISNGKEKEK